MEPEERAAFQEGHSSEKIKSAVLYVYVVAERVARSTRSCDSPRLHKSSQSRSTWRIRSTSSAREGLRSLRVRYVIQAYIDFKLN